MTPATALPLVPVLTGPGRPEQLGVHLRGDGVDVAVLSQHADAVELCVLHPEPGSSTGWREQPVRLAHRTDGVHHGHVRGIREGTRYGLRAHGPWRPDLGHRFNPAKLLVDPYARALDGEVRLGPAVYDHGVDAGLNGDPAQRSDLDSLGHVPLGVVVAPQPDVVDASRPRHRAADTVVYEAHVRGLTMAMPGVPEELRGTYAGLGHPATLEHLRGLGVTAVELLPVQAGAPEPHLVKLGLRNYWGYNTLAFLAPEPRYSAAVRAGRPAADAVAEFRAMADALHGAGLELLLDVVYNHTAEGGGGGPTYSFRGLDNTTYYRVHGPDYLDVTGTGNTLDLSHPEVLRLTLDSLRYWVTQLGVDGFRFDLAPALARRRDDGDRVGGFDRDSPFLVACRTDPVLRRTRLVAEPWDIGPYGWRTGQFPVPFADWNDHFRDDVRSFWLTGARAEADGRPGPGVRPLATRLTGSQDVFGVAWPDGTRGPLASVNLVTAHDGFTLADLVSYDTKHNVANGEDGRDGSSNNSSWNHGVEGPTDDPVAAAARQQSIRSILGTLLIATGTPMLLAGDEHGRSQGGNNNGYCQDNPTTWHDWQLAPWQRDLVETTRFLLRLRAEQPVLRQDRFFGSGSGRPQQRPRGTRDVAWFTGDGDELTDRDWHDPYRRTLLMFLDGDAVPPGEQPAGSLLVVFHGGAHGRDVHLPEPPWADNYRTLWSSSMPRPTLQRGPGGQFRAGPRDVHPGEQLRVHARTVTVLAAERTG